MDELKTMRNTIRKYSLLMMVPVCVISYLIWQDFYLILGIIIGVMAALIGYGMIERMALHIEDYGDATRKGYQNYALRYLLYAVIFALSVKKGIHPLSLLAGFLCHKAALVLYTFFNRKEVD